MVIWKLAADGGRRMTFRPSGLTDHGEALVEAIEADNGWRMECRVPGWDRHTEAWKENCALWVGQNSIRMDSGGLAFLFADRKPTIESTELHMMRLATLLSATVMAASFLRNEMGLQRQRFPSADASAETLSARSSV